MSQAKAATAREHALLSKIYELETEVRTLRTRLDELRKAKNTTHIKRERQVIEVKDPREAHGVAEIERLRQLLDDERKRHAKEIEQLRLGDSGDEKGRAQPRGAGRADALETKCDHEPVLLEMKRRVADMESQNTALALENSELHERLRTLTNELSVKEAKWCEQEEAMKTTLQKKWEQMYLEWMRTTEGKIAELQATNDLLRTMLNPNR